MRSLKILSLFAKKQPAPSEKRVTEQVNVKLPNGTDITFAWTPKHAPGKG